MTTGSTVYTFEIQLSDTTRSVYQQLSLRPATHPSETLEFLACRVLAYCLEFGPGIEFSKGLEDPEMPAIWAHDLTGQITHWIEIGTPSVEKLHKASKLVDQITVYTHKNPATALEQLSRKGIYRAESIRLFAFSNALLTELATQIEKRNAWDLARSDGHIYLDVAGKHLSAEIKSFQLTG